MKYTGLELLNAIKLGEIKIGEQIDVKTNTVNNDFSFTIATLVFNGNTLVWDKGTFKVGYFWNDDIVFVINKEVKLPDKLEEIMLEKGSYITVEIASRYYKAINQIIDYLEAKEGE